MLLKSLSFEDKQTGWKLENLRLDRFNLLVGASGVGKTRILRAIRTVHRIGRGLFVRNFNQGVSFDIHFEHEGQTYRWQFDSAAHSPGPGDDEESAAALADDRPIVVAESLHSDVDGMLVKREQSQFLFRDKELPMLNRHASALQLLDEPSINQLKQAFAKSFLEALDSQSTTHRIIDAQDWAARKFPSFDSLRSYTDRPPVVKAFVLQERFAAQFDQFKQLFIDIFPTVADVAVARRESGSMQGRAMEHLSFKLKEHGVPKWIRAEDISSGMARTLNHLVDLMLAPAGTVVLIDEFENSLGVNCMGPLTDFILSRANDLQFIITSHHPYIINNIPKSHWKLVRRKGSTVRVTPASEIPALQGPSAQDDFIRLINSPEFEEGME